MRQDPSEDSRVTKPGRPSPDRPSWRIPALLAVFAVLIRLPFLLKGEAFFNSDEAIEGLMARHLGDWPIFFWGQGYKGVPEVYLTGMVFAVFGVGVVQLKAVTLGIWACAVAATTRVGQRWYGDHIAAIAGAILAVGSTVLASWSLSANAEVAWLILIVALILISGFSVQGSAFRVETPATVFVLCGLALWIHPVAIWIVVTLAVSRVARSEWWRAHGWRGVTSILTGEGLSPLLRAVVIAVHVLVAASIVVFAITYVGGTIQSPLITASHPQKVLRAVAALAILAAGLHALIGAFGRRTAIVRAIGWTTVGLAPVLVYLARGTVPSAPIVVSRIAEAPNAIRTLTTFGVPMAIGLRDWAGVPIEGGGWLTLAFLIPIGVFLLRGRDTLRVFAMVSLAVFALLLIPGGVFHDLQSNRYLMPWFGIAALAAAAGLSIVWRRSRLAAGALLAMILAGFVWGQVRWYKELGLDESDRQVSACLAVHGIHTAIADYWIAYRFTFFAHEDVIVVPDSELADRYAPYRARVMAAPTRARIVRTENVPAGAEVLCTSSSLAAVR